MIIHTVYNPLALGSVIKEDKNWSEYQHLWKLLILYFPEGQNKNQGIAFSNLAPKYYYYYFFWLENTQQRKNSLSSEAFHNVLLVTVSFPYNMNTKHAKHGMAREEFTWVGSGGLITKLSLTLVSPWTVAPARLLCPWGFPRQEFWRRLLFPSPGRSFWPREWTLVSASCIAGRFFTNWTTREALRETLISHSDLCSSFTSRGLSLP